MPYGFRPGRGPHMANGLMGLGGGWVVDLDIRTDEVGAI